MRSVVIGAGGDAQRRDFGQEPQRLVGAWCLEERRDEQAAARFRFTQPMRGEGGGIGVATAGSSVSVRTSIKSWAGSSREFAGRVVMSQRAGRLGSRHSRRMLDALSMARLVRRASRVSQAARLA